MGKKNASENRQDDFEKRQIENLQKRQKENKKSVAMGRRKDRNEFLTDTLRIPPDIASGTMRVTLTGNSRLWVENYQRIMEYTVNRIVLQGKKGKLCVAGEKLCIAYYNCDDMLIRGIIVDIHLDGENNGLDEV